MERRNFNKSANATGSALIIHSGGLLAGKELKYDPEAGRVTNEAVANNYLHKKYLKGWVLHG